MRKVLSLAVFFCWLLAASPAFPATAITGLTEDTAPSTSDYLVEVDVSDTSMSTSGTTKKVTLGNLLGGNLSGLRGMTDPAADRLIWWNNTTNQIEAYVPTEWRFVYSGASSALSEVAFGSQYTLLMSNGASAAPSWTGTLNFDPLVAPNGANPTTDAAGEIAVDTSATTGAMFRFYADAAYALPAYQSVSATIKGTTADENYPLWKFPYAITIRAIKVYAIGGTNVVGGLHECTGTNGVCSGKTAVDADITGTAGSEVADDGSLTNPGITAGNYIQWYTTSVSGTNTSLTVTMYYTVDQVN